MAKARESSDRYRGVIRPGRSPGLHSRALVQTLRPDRVAGMKNLAELFKGRHYESEIFVLCVRWYLGIEVDDALEISEQTEI